MINTDSSSPGLTWLAFAMLTVVSWGVYGIFLHTGTMGMADPANGRIKAFLFVGIAYFLTAVLAPLAILMSRGSTWTFPAPGLWWSLIAGIVGAIGALGVLLAFGAAPKPTASYVPVIMSIIFAGAPIVNAVVAFGWHPPAGGLSAIKPQFLLGILLAAVGGFLVTLYKPDAPAAPPKAAPHATQAEAAGH
ncbi:MAG TPA: hypothetical protein VLU94_02755 [Candidatus Nitrosotalea sp.]|nr:hypothetical protein [Candidatus Nitrosotalea sp.]